MKKNISFRLWLAVFCGGIRQVVSKFFKWIDSKPIWKFAGACLGLLMLTCCFAIWYAAYESNRRESRWTDCTDVSDRIRFVRKSYSSEPGWISGRLDEKKLIENVDWVVVPYDGDSLAVFSQNRKRGYFNRFTGKVSIPPRFDAAWIFSNGIAAVADADSIFFIDRSGVQVFGRKFLRDYWLDYVFYGDYCVMSGSEGRFGLIDKSGNWVIAPEYDRILPAAHNYWKMLKGDEKSGLWYAFTDKAEQVNAEGVTDLDITEDLGVIFTLPNHLKMVVDFNGDRQEKFLCHEIEAMYYDTDCRDCEGKLIQERTTLYRYRMDDGYEGLCREDGELVTEPLYWLVKPIGRDLYHCTYKDTDCGVIINSEGKVTSQN